MSTRCYDTDLNDAAWAWIAPYLPAARSGGRPRTTDLRAVLNAIFYLLRTGCQWRLCYPASSRARAPFTITFVPGKMRASWPNCNGRFMSRRA
jgi:transposase